MQFWKKQVSSFAKIQCSFANLQYKTPGGGGGGEEISWKVKLSST